MNGHIAGFHPQTQKLEQLYETQSFRRAVKVSKIVSIYNPVITFKYENQSFAHPSKMSSLLGVAGKRRIFTLGEVLNFEDARPPFARSVKTNQKNLTCAG